jgi:Uma2 family endonuclease
MSLAEIPALTTQMTVEEFLALPDDDIERDLIRGELRVWGESMTRRNPMHGETEVNISQLLKSWRDVQPLPRGKVVGGETGFRLRRNPITFVGIDVAYVSAEMVAAHDRKRKFFDGPPVLAVEILSPSDKHEKVVEKVEIYLEVGTVVWVVDPDFRTVSVHRRGEPLVTFNDQQELSGEPYLPGFRIEVAKLFDT